MISGSIASPSAIFLTQTPCLSSSVSRLTLFLSVQVPTRLCTCFPDIDFHAKIGVIWPHNYYQAPLENPSLAMSSCLRKLYLRAGPPP